MLNFMTRLKPLATIVLLLCLPIATHADNAELIQKLDSIIKQRALTTGKKEAQLKSLKERAAKERQPLHLLRLYRQITDEYYVYQYDSAMVYVKKGNELASKVSNTEYANLFTITNVELLTLAGLYHEASQMIENIDYDQLSTEIKQRYNIALFTLYNYWGDYCGDATFKPVYKERAKKYLTDAISLMKGTEQNYDYMLGEYQVYVNNDLKAALKYYLNALNNTKENTREYAMAAFAIANNYSAQGNYDKYVEYLTLSAISDMASATKENLSLQYLASYLYEKGQHERAENYIQISLEDAKFYNNKLRMLEASKLMPQIAQAYQDTIKTQNYRLKYFTIGTIILCMLLISLFYYIYKKNLQLRKQRKDISQKNQNLQSMTSQLENVNARLSEANEIMADTNHKREILAQLFINLCAKYIDRMKSYQKLVKRKIKANQASELLTTISSSRISEEDAAIFLHGFDKAFTDLYPTFVDEFNSLMSENSQFTIEKGNTLPTELRIYALVRLGVKDSSEIADLLFYSPQTIYNYRSMIKSKARCKETFDDDVRQLCTTIRQ